MPKMFETTSRRREFERLSNEEREAIGLRNLEDKSRRAYIEALTAVADTISYLLFAVMLMFMAAIVAVAIAYTLWTA